MGASALGLLPKAGHCTEKEGGDTRGLEVCATALQWGGDCCLPSSAARGHRGAAGGGRPSHQKTCRVGRGVSK